MKAMTRNERRYWKDMAAWNIEREELRQERVRAANLQRGGR